MAPTSIYLAIYLSLFTKLALLQEITSEKANHMCSTQN